MPLATPVAISFEPKKIHRLHRANKRGGLTRSSPETIQKKKAAAQWTSALHRSRCWFHGRRACPRRRNRQGAGGSSDAWAVCGIECRLAVLLGPFSQINTGAESAGQKRVRGPNGKGKFFKDLS